MDVNHKWKFVGSSGVELAESFINDSIVTSHYLRFKDLNTNEINFFLINGSHIIKLKYLDSDVTLTIYKTDYYKIDVLVETDSGLIIGVDTSLLSCIFYTSLMNDNKYSNRFLEAYLNISINEWDDMEAVIEAVDKSFGLDFETDFDLNALRVYPLIENIDVYLLSLILINLDYFIFSIL